MATCNPNTLLEDGKAFQSIATDEQFWMAALQLLCEISGLSGSLLQGTGVPSAGPANLAAPAYYTRTTNGQIYTWNVAGQAWVPQP